jgi:hypothetical protein
MLRALSSFENILLVSSILRCANNYVRPRELNEHTSSESDFDSAIPFNSAFNDVGHSTLTRLLDLIDEFHCNTINQPDEENL